MISKLQGWSLFNKCNYSLFIILQKSSENIPSGFRIKFDLKNLDHLRPPKINSAQMVMILVS